MSQSNGETRNQPFRYQIGERLSIFTPVIRDRVFNSRYWKEECFALNAESIISKCENLQYVGFSYGAFNRPTPFLCLLVKLVQIFPSFEIIQSYIDHSAGEPSNDSNTQRTDLRYLRALSAAYVRLMCRPEVSFAILEPLYEDYRTIIILDSSASFMKLCMDEWIAQLLTESGEPVWGFHFPHLTKRAIIQSKGDIREYISPLEDELDR